MTTKIIKFSVFFLVFSVCLVSTIALATSDYKDILTDKIIKVNNPDDQSEKSGTIIIDAGHGGMDGGAVGIGGVLEKDIDLSIALTLGELLSSSGYDVIYTRTDDRMLGDGEGGSAKLADLRARVDIANANEGATFVSIHANKFPQEYCRDMQLYYSKNDARSERLASLIASRDKEYLEFDNKREPKRADSAIYVLDRAKIPAVLVECGFLSNEEEAHLLCERDYQKKLCAVIASAICEYTNSK